MLFFHVREGVSDEQSPTGGVALRVGADQSSIEVHTGTTQVEDLDIFRYSFDSVLSSNYTQTAFYDRCLRPVVSSVAAGSSGSLVFMGPRSGGKTFSVEGTVQAGQAVPGSEGAVSRAVHQLLSAHPDIAATVSIQCIAVIGNTGVDLLSPDRSRPVKVREMTAAQAVSRQVGRERESYLERTSSSVTPSLRLSGQEGGAGRGPRGRGKGRIVTTYSNCSSVVVRDAEKVGRVISAVRRNWRQVVKSYCTKTDTNPKCCRSGMVHRVYVVSLRCEAQGGERESRLVICDLGAYTPPSCDTPTYCALSSCILTLAANNRPPPPVTRHLRVDDYAGSVRVGVSGRERDKAKGGKVVPFRNSMLTMLLKESLLHGHTAITGCLVPCVHAKQTLAYLHRLYTAHQASLSLMGDRDLSSHRGAMPSLTSALSVGVGGMRESVGVSPSAIGYSRTRGTSGGTSPSRESGHMSMDAFNSHAATPSRASRPSSAYPPMSPSYTHTQQTERGRESGYGGYGSVPERERERERMPPMPRVPGSTLRHTSTVYPAPVPMSPGGYGRGGGRERERERVSVSHRPQPTPGNPYTQADVHIAVDRERFSSLQRDIDRAATAATEERAANTTRTADLRSRVSLAVEALKEQTALGGDVTNDIRQLRSRLSLVLSETQSLNEEIATLHARIDDGHTEREGIEEAETAAAADRIAIRVGRARIDELNDACRVLGEDNATDMLRIDVLEGADAQLKVVQRERAEKERERESVRVAIASLERERDMTHAQLMEQKARLA
ncbi:hypothetical protein KIPB_007313, partial [Kipferlia bialata]|eukprot:g7313.t1